MTKVPGEQTAQPQREHQIGFEDRRKAKREAKRSSQAKHGFDKSTLRLKRAGENTAGSRARGTAGNAGCPERQTLCSLGRGRPRPVQAQERLPIRRSAAALFATTQTQCAPRCTVAIRPPTTPIALGARGRSGNSSTFYPPLKLPTDPVAVCSSPVSSPAVEESSSFGVGKLFIRPRGAAPNRATSRWARAAARPEGDGERRT